MAASIENGQPKIECPEDDSRGHAAVVLPLIPIFVPLKSRNTLFQRAGRFFQNDIVLISTVLGVLLSIPLLKSLTSEPASAHRLKAKAAAKPKSKTASPDAQSVDDMARIAEERRKILADRGMTEGGIRTPDEEILAQTINAAEQGERDRLHKAKKDTSSFSLIGGGGELASARLKPGSYGGTQNAAASRAARTASGRFGGSGFGGQDADAARASALNALNISGNINFRRGAAPSLVDGKALQGRNGEQKTLGKESPSYKKAKDNMEHQLQLQWSQYKPQDPGHDQTYADNAKRTLVATLKDTSDAAISDHALSGKENEDETLEKEVEKTDDIRGQIDALAFNIQTGAGRLRPMQGQAQSAADQGDKLGCENTKNGASGLYGMLKAECSHGQDLVKRCGIDGDAITDRFRSNGWSPATGAERDLCNAAASSLLRACSSADSANSGVQGVSCDK